MKILNKIKTFYKQFIEILFLYYNGWCASESFDYIDHKIIWKKAFIEPTKIKRQTIYKNKKASYRTVWYYLPRSSAVTFEIKQQDNPRVKNAY
jgi:hypothetical protein